MAAAQLLHFHSLDSTNAEAARLITAGTVPPFWILGDEQTAGRGRLGRVWFSPPGNLHATYVFETTAAPQHLPQIGFVAALAVYETLAPLYPARQFSLKWPNDVLADGAKCCGILAEVISSTPTIIAVGCGVNLAHCPSGLPYPVTALGGDLKPQQVWQKLGLTFDNYLKIWNRGKGFESLRQAWLTHAFGLGEVISVNGRKGRFIGLASDGALLLESEIGKEEAIYAGDMRQLGEINNYEGTS